MKLGKYSFGTGDRFSHQGEAQLAATLFPLGDLIKNDVRRMAAEAGLPTAAVRRDAGSDREISFGGAASRSRPLRYSLTARLGRLPPAPPVQS